ncbi:hypothetical protein C4587_01245 [Candidatus Parcubacteria bacterium]|nr:MAG: hypothetical protein C4587_01245 [Candidatus Parcubacteria bacterium]
MTTILQQQALDRWDTLPEALREALFLPQNSRALWDACEREHVPGEKIPTVARIAGLVVMGFIHPEDAAAEIRDALEINPKIAESIAKTLIMKIFSPLRTELDKIYSPPTKEPLRVAAETPAPEAPAATPAVPEDRSREKPEEKIDRILLEIQGLSAKTEFRKPMEPSDEKSSPAPAALPASPIREEAPVVLQEETGQIPIAPTKGFRLDILPRQFEGVKAEADASGRIAQVELGGEKPNLPPALAKPEPPKPRVVHYGTWKTPLGSQKGDPVQILGIAAVEAKNPELSESRPEAPRASVPQETRSFSPFEVLGEQETAQKSPISPPAQKMPVTLPQPGKKEGKGESSFLGKLAFWRKKEGQDAARAIQPATPKAQPGAKAAGEMMKPPSPPVTAPLRTEQGNGGAVVDLRSFGVGGEGGESDDARNQKQIP